MPSSAPRPNPNWGLRRLYFQLVLSPSHPTTHPDKFKFDLKQHDSQGQSCLFGFIGPITAFGSILRPTVPEHDPNKFFSPGWYNQFSSYSFSTLDFNLQFQLQISTSYFDFKFQQHIQISTSRYQL